MLSGKEKIDAHILSFLTMDELLRYRRTSKKIQETIKKLRYQHPGPYKTPCHFMFAVFGELRTHSGFFRKRDATNAWALYMNTLRHAAQTKPAIIYKLRDASRYKGKLPDESIEILSHDGRRYNPPSQTEHSWPVNTIWLLAQMHAYRSLFVISALIPNNVMRKDFPGEFSAFAKELTAGYKADYHATNLDHRGFLLLKPSRSKTAMQTLTASDLQSTPSEVDAAINQFNQERARIEAATPEVETKAEKNTAPLLEVETLLTQPGSATIQKNPSFWSCSSIHVSKQSRRPSPGILIANKF